MMPTEEIPLKMRDKMVSTAAFRSKRMRRKCRRESAAVRRSLMILMMDIIGSGNQPRKDHKGYCW